MLLSLTVPCPGNIECVRKQDKAWAMAHRSISFFGGLGQVQSLAREQAPLQQTRPD